MFGNMVIDLNLINGSINLGHSPCLDCIHRKLGAAWSLQRARAWIPCTYKMLWASHIRPREFGRGLASCAIARGWN